MNRNHNSTAALLLCATIATVTMACGRDEVWETTANDAQAIAMSDSVALVDFSASRLLTLAPSDDLSLQQKHYPLNEGYVNAVATPDGNRLLVLSRGVVPRQRASDAGPMLQVLDGPSSPAFRQYPLSDPLSGIALDPQSKFAVLYPLGDSAFVQNPNELAIVDLERAPAADNPSYVTLRSFGGEPQGFTFTPLLDLPGGPMRLLVVQTDRDVALVNLTKLDLPEITVPVATGGDTFTPGHIAVSNGDPADSNDARIAIQLVGQSNVIVVDLLPVPEEQAGTTPQSFRAVPNVVFVGGSPNDIAFVQTDGGLRLAALVGSNLTLVDPETGIAGSISLGQHFSRLSLVTNVVGETTDGSDVALLWSATSTNIGFVALGSTVGQPYKSVEMLPLGAPVADVYNVSGDSPHLRILRGIGSKMFVLDLLKRTAAPLISSAGATVTTSPDGQRAWVSKGRALAQLDLDSLHPKNFELTHDIDSVFDIERPSGRAVIAIHREGALGATVLDARQPSLAGAYHYSSLLLGDLR